MNLRTFFFSLRWYVVGVFCLFLVCAGIAFVFPSLFTFFDPYLEDLFAQASTLEGLELFWFIFLNNVRAAFVGVLGGILFGFIPLGIALMNGAVLGYVGALVSAEEGFGAMWRLLPHGIFELPALFFALALGMRLGVASGVLVYALIMDKRTDDFWEVCLLSSKLFVCVIIPLLFLAGCIETWLISSGV